MKVLLSPAKAIDVTRKLKTTECSTPIFINDAALLMNKVKKFSVNKIGKMMSLSKDLSQLNFDRNQEWSVAEDLSESAIHAAAAFNGEVYRGLDAPTMTKEQLKRAQNDIRILSGLYGLLKPLDVIYPYRLEMGTKWAVTASKSNLYKFWGNKLAEQLNSENEDGIIVNCASNEYFKALDKKTLKGRVITPVFKEFKNGEYKIIMVFAKKARGYMARFIIDNNIKDPEQIKLFDTDGYMFDVNQSTENEWIFTR